MEFTIVKAHADIGQIEVAYTCDGKNLGVVTIDVPIIDGAFISGSVLNAEIRSRAPTWLDTRKEEVSTAAGFDQIEASVSTAPIFTGRTEAMNHADMWAQVAYEKKLVVALIKFGVLQTDPTSVEITVL